MAWWSWILLLCGCGSLSPVEAGSRLDEAVASVVQDEDEVRHAVLHVDAPGLGLSGTWAHGAADVRGAAMTAQTPFLSASVGKLFTAVTVLRLVDDGALKLSDPITTWLPAEQLAGLPLDDGATYADITVAQLLAHRSGFPDYFVGESVDGTASVFEQWVAEPDQAWTRDGLLGHVRDHQEAVGAPGTVFAYADTNYDLLGLIIESATGSAHFQDVVQAQIMEPLKLRDTAYHHTPEGVAIEGAWAEAWAGDVALAHAACLSGDQAGGGLITTTSDLATFLRALAQGTLVDIARLEGGRNATEDAMNRGIHYGYGLWRIEPGRVSFLLGGMPELQGASGATGSFAYYVDAWDAVIVGTFDQTEWQEKHVQFLLSKVLPTLARVDPDA